MRILFVVSQTNLLRHFESVIAGLASRGHEIRIAAPRRERDIELPRPLQGQAGVTEVDCPGERVDEWRDVAPVVRSARDYTRYLESDFAKAAKPRDRALRKFLQTLTGGEQMHFGGRCGACQAPIDDEFWSYRLIKLGLQMRRNVSMAFERVEASIPSDPGIERFIRGERPDVLVITPLVTLGSWQPDYVKSARRLGVPSVFPVFSWDNLTSKGPIHVMPDVVQVWNDIQRREAVQLLGVPEARVVVTGAPRFDDFLALRPATTRADYCARGGLDPSLPIVTYLCSSDFVARQEMAFVERWIDAVRASGDSRLQSVNLVVRPHPRRKAQWLSWSTGRWRRVALSTSDFTNADQELYDCLHHSAVVVGLNTSAEIEAGLLGAAVQTIATEEFAEGQEGTLHFHYLLTPAGFVEVATSLEDHLRRVASALDAASGTRQVPEFLQKFVRPRGFDVPATIWVVDNIEATARRRGLAALARRLSFGRRASTAS